MIFIECNVSVCFVMITTSMQSSNLSSLTKFACAVNFKVVHASLYLKILCDLDCNKINLESS